MTFKIPEGKEVKDFGFTVYDAETGDPVNYEEIAKEVDCPIEYADEFVFTQNGWLYFTDSMGYWYSLTKANKYIIQFADGRYMRY